MWLSRAEEREKEKKMDDQRGAPTEILEEVLERGCLSQVDIL